MQYALDSDWAIEYLRGNERFVGRIASLLPSGIGISVITLAELYDGVAAADNPIESERELIAFVNRLTLLSVDPEVARIFGFQRRRLRRAGERVEDMDLLIGATALPHGLTLLTNNRRHFDRIPNLMVESI
ncbi:MAG: type II toxin-antitoxin system VapC family toxin [Chloroflexi bacterium]|nr:type II toxin-antitoxin system VapC family toxin [Chloroflexota bacterium]